ncbi:benenodin family lasso peptide [Sphingobium yanoikuyae]|nr:benenodin family lasso peptide [Sphingobium yanoikuyae]MDV3482008.1 benenodin family lasso peptide [Sphingobium yanoikuyae]
MERVNEELIDLGSVVEETKGGAPGLGDTVIQQQLGGAGLTDD